MEIKYDTSYIFVGIAAGLLSSTVRRINPLNSTFCGIGVAILSSTAIYAVNQNLGNLPPVQSLKTNLGDRKFKIILEGTIQAVAGVSLLALGIFNTQLLALSLFCSLGYAAWQLKGQHPSPVGA